MSQGNTEHAGPAVDPASTPPAEHAPGEHARSDGPRRPLPPAAALFRWASLGLAVILATLDAEVSTRATVLSAACGLVMAAAQPVIERWVIRRRKAAVAAVLVEVLVASGVVIGTGLWSSPFLLFYFVPVLDAGFLLGLRTAAATAILAGAIPVFAAALGGPVSASDWRAAAVWTFSWLVAGAVASYARSQASALATWQRLLDTERRETALRLATIEDANLLLSELHEMAMTLPATLDAEGLVEATLDRAQELFPTKTAAVVACDESRFRILGVRGTALPIVPIPRSEATPPLRIAAERPVTAVHVQPGSTLDPAARSLLYVPLKSEGHTIGILALEDDDPDRFGTDDIAPLMGFAGPVAVSLENARLFSRLRALATSEERSRIARELHDRTAQHLAAIAFELDVLARRAAKALASVDRRNDAAAEVVATAPAPSAATAATGADTDLISEIDALSKEIRRAIEDLRITIGDLRTDVTEQRGLVELLREHAPTVAAKAHMRVELELPPDGVRLPVPQERELWRICQEAIGNVVKHSGTTTFKVGLHVTRESADLRIEDSGCGFNPRIPKPGHFGLTGMSERAEAIGAEFNLDSTEGYGTVLAVTLRRKT